MKLYELVGKLQQESQTNPNTETSGIVIKDNEVFIKKPADTVTIYTDGGCSGNPGPMGIGVVVIKDGHTLLTKKSRPKNQGTNNIAEYLAIIEALKISIEKGYQDITIKSDSQLCVGQLSKGWNINSSTLQSLNEKAKELENQLNSVTYVYIRRKENIADKLANMGPE